MEEHLTGSTQPVLSIWLEPGESVVAEAGEFSWMTDSIQMSADPDGGAGGQHPGSGPAPGGSALPLSTYTAKREAGMVAFTSKLPGTIKGVDVTPGAGYLVHRRGFLAGTPGIQVTAGFRHSFGAGVFATEGFVLRRIEGAGRAWIELAGDVVKRDLAANMALRVHPGNVGMFEASVAVQVASVRGIASRYFGADAHHVVVLSGPGAVWLQALPLPLLAATAALLDPGAPPRHPARQRRVTRPVALSRYFLPATSSGARKRYG